MSAVSYIFDSNITVATATLLTAGAAYFVYYRQKADAKRNSANTIPIEIQSAERRIRSIKKSISEQDVIPETTYLMRDQSWSQHKNQFVKDFSRDDWDTITEFYENCQLYDEALRKNGDAFGGNEQQIRVTAHHAMNEAVTSLIDAVLQNPDSREQEVITFNQRNDILNDVYLAEAHKPLYTPKKYLKDARAFLDQLKTNVSQTSPGATLKRLANVRK